MSVIGSGIFIFLGLGFLLSVILVIIAVVCIIHYTNKKKPLERSCVSVPEQVSPQQEEIRKTLGETLKELRTERNMTQEFVAESLGLSRQAVSKWENGTSEPSTTNLIAIAKLYGIEPEELLKKII